MTDSGDPADAVFRVTLPETFSLIDAADHLADRGGLLWLDSSSRGPERRPGRTTGRYSFLSVDPIETWTATLANTNAWQALASRVRSLESEVASHDDTGPSMSVDADDVAAQSSAGFTGGWAGVIGYEAGSLLEPTGVSANESLSRCVMHFGLYDWVLRTDHETQTTHLIVPRWSLRRRPHRCEEVMTWIEEIGKQAIAPEPPVNAARGGATPRSNFGGGEFSDAVADVVGRIRRGDSFQVNLAQTLWAETDLPPMRLYRHLRRRNPAPMAGYYDAGCHQVLCSSPEGFLRIDGDEVETRPIKGTVKRTGDADRDASLADQLRQSQKDRAENIMIVDLMRNDLSRVCEIDSVATPSVCSVEPYQFVQHLVSVVRGRLRPDRDVMDLLMACFPGGSITGAPKVEAMRTIAELEPDQRGAYCGSMGYFDPHGTSEWNICIRTMIHRDGRLQIPVGGGITARSDPAAEEAETWIKAEGMLRALR